MKDCMVTTMDNPENPFTHFSRWLEYDITHGYNTLGLWGYFTEASSLMDDDEYDYEAELGIDKLLENSFYGLHYRLFEENADEIIKLMNEVYRETEMASQ